MELEIVPVLTTAPHLDLEDEYRQLADGFWIAPDWYFDLGDDVTVATVLWDNDRPGGADTGYIDRHGDHYLFWIVDVDIWEYVGKFDSTREAIESWTASNVVTEANRVLKLIHDNWVGPPMDSQ